jgi:DNA repair protein SbcD/Mre11
VRYSGSPIPLSLAEKDYPHQVLLLDLVAMTPVEVRALPVPRHIEILRIPEGGPAPLDEVLRELAALPEREEGSREEQQPMLEVRVRLDAPEPGLRRRIEEVLEGHPPGEKPLAKQAPRKKAARLVKLTIERSGKALALSDETNVAELRELEVEEVFRKRYAQVHEGEVTESLLEAFRELRSLELEEDAS